MKSGTSSKRRGALRDLTRLHHARLDAEVGEFSDRRSYERYLRAMAAFRCRVEGWIDQADWPAGFGAWRPTLASPWLLEDMRDLGLESPDPACGCSGPGPTQSELLGILYVLEGAGLGARLLRRRAETLGFDCDRGARHLAFQSERQAHWVVFLDLLETVPDFDLAEAGAAAIETFDTAYNEFKRIPNAQFAG